MLILSRILASSLLAIVAIGNLAVADSLPPLERVATTPKGQLISPYPDFARVAAECRRIYHSL